jgi:phenylpyruvate tautomerase PptA (4-oxalocrotonate tautomerase family)
LPTYVCSAATRQLTPFQKAEIVRSITAIHHEETGARRYLVQVIFHDVAPGNHSVAGRPAPADQIWFRADIRGGRTTSRRASCFDGRRQGQRRCRGRGLDLPVRYSRSEYRRVRPRPAAPQGGGRVVLVATRCHAGQAQALSLTNSKRWIHRGLTMPTAKIHVHEHHYDK